MNLFNRIVIILFILAVMIIVPLILMVPGETQAWLRYAADVIQANVAWLEGLQPAEQIGVRLILGAVSMAVFVLGLLLLALEVIRVRRSTVKLRDGSGELIMNGVTEHLSYYVDLLPDVLRVRPVVQSAGKGVRVALNVETPPGVNVLEKSDEVRRTAHQVLEEQLGLDVKGEIKVVIKPMPHPKGHRGKRPVLAVFDTKEQAGDAKEALRGMRPLVGVEGTPSILAPEREEPVPALELEDVAEEASTEGGQTIEVKAPSAEGDAKEDVTELPDESAS